MKSKNKEVSKKTGWIVAGMMAGMNFLLLHQDSLAAWAEKFNIIAPVYIHESVQTVKLMLIAPVLNFLSQWV